MRRIPPRHLLNVPFVLLAGCSSVLLAFCMNVLTGGEVPPGLRWTSPWQLPALVISITLTVAYPLWQYVRESRREGGGRPAATP